ncbi:hypothetical protein DPX16_1668 [Anabarilius grahami]|uniref:AIG1-type G domain-containing protein n=1 Tax=Anabarilius grahami TaxID=495550 RepID=A0A3N0Y2W1_ANAGA|nr:hypothetical protein DPX16_1668 [Anabarilius grahami]
MFKYLLGVKFEEELWYEITEEAATRGLEKDLKVAENLSTLFQSSDGVCEVDAVCFASKNRLSDRQHYIISSILSLFGKDIVNNIVFLITHSDGLPPKNVIGAINKARIPCRRDHNNQPVHFLFNNRQADARHPGECYVRAQKCAWEDSMEEIKKFLQSLDEKNRRSLELTSDVLIERIILEASMCNLQLRVQEKESKKEAAKVKVPIESASWKSRKAMTCTVCEENCHEFDCWWVSNPNQCEVMKNGFCTVCTGKSHHSKHVKENKKYVIRNSSMTIEFDDVEKECEKAQEQSKRLSVVMDYLDQDLQDIEDQQSEAYMTIKHLSQISLKPDSAFTLQHLDFFIPKLREAGKQDWVRELEDLRRTAEAEEANKDALSYLKAGLAKLNLFFSGQ